MWVFENMVMGKCLDPETRDQKTDTGNRSKGSEMGRSMHTKIYVGSTKRENVFSRLGNLFSAINNQYLTSFVILLFHFW
jgi:hypothetical protein